MYRFQVSLHDVTPVLDRQSRIMAEGIHGVVGSCYTMLVVPNYHGRGSLSGAPDFCRWLRELKAEGVEIALHGCFHSDPRNARSLLTAGEGEFSSASRDEAEESISTALNIFTDALGFFPDGFTAPAWLYGPGIMEVVPDFGFPWVEHRSRIDFKSGGRVRAPVVVFASRSPMKRNVSRLWSVLSPFLFTAFPLVRAALHTMDLAIPGDCPGNLLRSLNRRRRSTVCGDLAHG